MRSALLKNNGRLDSKCTATQAETWWRLITARVQIHRGRLIPCEHRRACLALLLAPVAISDGMSQRECMHECLLVRFTPRPHSLVPPGIIGDFPIV